MAQEENDDLHDIVTKMADRLKLKGSERTKYIHDHMTRGGYKAVPNYVRADEEDEEDRDDTPFFSRRRRNRDDSGDRRRPRGSSRGDSWYDD